MASSVSSSPPNHGYDTAGEELDTSCNEAARTGGRTRTKRLVKTTPRGKSARELPRDASGRFVPRRPLLPGSRRDSGDGDDSELGSATDLVSVSSLTWDDTGAPLNQTSGTTRRWSTETQFSVPAASGFSGSELPTHPEGRESAASGHVTDHSLDTVIYNYGEPTMDETRRRREQADKALLEVEDDILPFRGKRLTQARLTALSGKATELKRQLQDCHLYLAAHDRDEYDANLRGVVTENRQLLSAFIVELEEQQVVQEDAAAAAAAEAAARAAKQAQTDENEEKLNSARLDMIRGRVSRKLKELKQVEKDCVDFNAVKHDGGDEQLHELAERHKVLDGRLNVVIEESKEVADHAMEYDLIGDSEAMYDAVAGLRGLKQINDQTLLAWRKAAGVWASKRSAGRGDLKMPLFSGSSTDMLTIYEFQKEWLTYKAAVKFSVEEGLKELKMAVQLPARAAIVRMDSEVEVMKYLHAHYGNPVLLLSAREAEIKGWAECKGGDKARREWLMNAKNKLDATVTLCEEHGISKYLHFSSIAGIVQSKLPYDMVKDFKKILVKHLTPSGILEKEIIVQLLIDFIEEKILDCTLGVNLEIVNFLGDSANPAGSKMGVQGASGPVQQGTSGASGGGDKWRSNYKPRSNQYNSSSITCHKCGQEGHYARDCRSNVSSGGGGQSGQQARDNPRKCVSCGKEHPFLFYCEDYIKAKVNERFQMVKLQKTCVRCLTMGRKFSSKKSEWWAAHEGYCRTTFTCKEGQCATRPKDKQLHVTICFTHATENQAAEPDFVRSLNAKELPAGFSPINIRFLHMASQLAYTTTAAVVARPTIIDAEGYEIIPDVAEPAIFMLQILPSDSDPTKDLLCFYDSGCGSAGLSDRACGLIKTETVRVGPTVLDVAGGKSILVPYGDEKFFFEVDGTKQKATFTGLRMPTITTSFPVFKIAEAWHELQQAASADGRGGELPEADPEVGGKAVDVIIGAKYFKYYPVLVMTLPSGLTVYRAKLRSASGRQAVLGGPHAAWARAVGQTQHMNPKVYLTHEARAWYQQETWARINQHKFVRDLQEDSEDEEEERHSEFIVETDSRESSCSHCHCDEKCGDKMMSVSAVQEEKNLWRVEQLGVESPYRCISCRNCNGCRNGETLETISFKEEAEQALIEDSIHLDVEINTLWAKLPFIEDPVLHLKPNRGIAEKVLQAQLRLFEKNPSMRADTVKSHQKLVDRGHVVAASALPDWCRRDLDKFAGDGYFIPWRTVYNEGSISTPCRMVFDASSKTPGGDSLNGVLAKGQNRLSKLQHLLIRFRREREAVTADISMAYNGTKLRPEHYKFQKYLWKQEMQPSNPTTVHYITTLIYGVKSSGQQCQVSIEKLAGHFQHRGSCLEGANALKDDTYVDDIITSRSSFDSCRQVATEVAEILAKGSMGVKAFSFSRSSPSGEVSGDGIHVGLAGYLWATEEDVLRLDVGPPRLGRAKRGRRPQAIAGDFSAALRQCFTRRILTGLVASVFDPLGLATPVTAGFKLDLHQLCSLKLDWDDAVPLHLLDKWVDNMNVVQELKELRFKRTVIPVDAVSSKIELLIACDASQNIGVVAVYGRVRRTNGLYSCQLLVGRSKILSGLTIPKAEMKSAVAAAVTASVVRRNLGEQFDGATFVTDSTICLYWITQDDRPLQVGVRNAVAEVRRFTSCDDWFHVESSNNIADLGTRGAVVEDIGYGSAWQEGHDWMKQPREKMPIRTAAAVTLTAEEARVAAVELRAGDVRGHRLHSLQTVVGDRYSYSEYVVDPCQQSWTKTVRIMAIVQRFVSCCKEARSAAVKRREAAQETSQQQKGELLSLTDNQVRNAEDYFFKKGTAEVLHFSKPKDYRNCSQLKDGILYFSGRLLDSGAIFAMEQVMFDLSPVTFCRPILDKHSPVAYSIMLETHWSRAHHLNATTTYRESLGVAYIIGGRNLAQEIRDSCNFCKRFKAKLVEVEMGKIHQNRLIIAPPFTYCQVDLLGPYEARCEHNHRAVVKVWGVVFKDPASGAIFVHAMPKYDTSAFIQAYTRFSARFCHPKKLFPDAGSQLLKACKTMQIDWIDVSQTLNSKHGVGVEFEPCPVGGHNYHGQVERSIREVKKLFDTVYRGIRLDIMGFETAFAWLSNELNNLPICLGSKYRDLDSLDLLTPNRLIHGRANKRAMSGPCTVDKPSRMLEKMGEVFEAWWRAWHSEKLADYVAKPSKWLRSGPSLREGDIVIFQKSGGEQVLGSPIWTIGRVVEVEQSQVDGEVREVTIQYKNASENKFRETNRAARSVAVLHREDDLDLMQELNSAARSAERSVRQGELYVDRQLAVVREVGTCVNCLPPELCVKHTKYFQEKPYVWPSEPTVVETACNSGEGVFLNYSEAVSFLGDDCQFDQDSSTLCSKLKIHSDPW